MSLHPSVRGEDAAIRRMQAPDVARVAAIHHEALPQDFLPSLGLRFLERVYYPAALTAGAAHTLVAAIRNEPVGFVTVAHDSDRFSHEILRGRLHLLAGYALRAAARDGRHLLKSLAVLRAALSGSRDPIAGEIVFIAVDERFRGQGLGRTLVRSALAELASAGVPECRTKTLQRNAGVIRMYEEMGWRVRDHFTFLGNEYVTLVGSTSNVAATPERTRED